VGSIGIRCAVIEDFFGAGFIRRQTLSQILDLCFQVSNVEVRARVTESREVLGGFVLRAVAVFLERRNCKKA
jgi:hypothetical protein